MSRLVVCIFLVDFETRPTSEDICLFQYLFGNFLAATHHYKWNFSITNLRKSLSLIPSQEIYCILKICLLEIVFSGEDPGLLKSDGHGAPGQAILTAREPQTWIIKFKALDLSRISVVILPLSLWQIREEIFRMSTFLFLWLVTSFLRIITRSSIRASSLIGTFPEQNLYSSAKSL